MDNFQINVVSKNRDLFNLAVQLGFSGEGFNPKKATHYLIHPEVGFIFFWVQPKTVHHKEAQALPYPMEWGQAAELAWGWVNDPNTPLVNKITQGDAHNQRGWRVYNDPQWSHVNGDYAGIIAIQAHAAWSGK